MFAVRVVDLYHSEGQQPVPRQFAYAVYAARRLLATSYNTAAKFREVRAHCLQQVSAVVYYNVRAVFQHVLDVSEILLLARAVDGVHLHTSGGEGRGHVVLRGERVGAGDEHLRASGGQYAAEVGSLGLQVHAESDFQASEGLFTFKISLYPPQNGHIAPDPGNLNLAGRGEGYVAYFIHCAVPLNNLSKKQVILFYFTTCTAVVQLKFT